MRYIMLCSCKHLMDVAAKSRIEAVGKLKSIMSKDAIKTHFVKFHKGLNIPSKKDIDIMIEKKLMEAYMPIRV